MSKKTQNQACINALDKSAKSKKINKAFQFLFYNTGLLFVLIAYSELNTSIISL